MGEKKNNHERYSTLLPFRFSGWGEGGGGMMCVIFFFSPEEKWELSVKERTSLFW